jgi:NADH:ubiquinone oxidoreductase subunit 6 (subunit J)
MGLLGVFLALTLVRLNIQAPSRPSTYGTIKDVGAWLFGPAVIPFEAASALLTAGMVGAFAVARSNHKKVSMSGEAKLPAAKPAEGGEG